MELGIALVFSTLQIISLKLYRASQVSLAKKMLEDYHRKKNCLYLIVLEEIVPSTGIAAGQFLEMPTEKQKCPTGSMAHSASKQKLC